MSSSAGPDHPPRRVRTIPSAAPLVEPDLDELRGYALRAAALSRPPHGAPPLRRPLRPLDPLPPSEGYPGDRRRPPGRGRDPRDTCTDATGVAR